MQARDDRHSEVSLKLSSVHHATGTPESAFRRGIRGGARVLRDHMCKQMNPLNLERCCCMPKNVPGSDLVLQEIVAADPSHEKYQVRMTQPWSCIRGCGGVWDSL